MITEERAFEIIETAFHNLKGWGILEDLVPFNKNTILLGVGSPLDSIGFVTMFTEIEDELAKETGKDEYMVLSEINKFNINAPHVTSEILSKYIVELNKEV